MSRGCTGYVVLSTSLAILGVLAMSERPAEACGGCFNPPETPTVVTDHRMILSVAKDQSTLYDQIKYTGAPSAFAWVLPISGTVTVGLSADVVFGALDQMTQTQIIAPPRNCPPRPASCDFNAKNAGGVNAPALADVNDVSVLKKEVVGPYETVQLQASNPTALRDWLQTNGFNVPPDVAPVVDRYVAEKFNFLALKLVPGKGTQDMRPVRVTTKGANVALPLRMVAAGTGPVVGITLWVIGDGRYEPQPPFGSFVIAADEISWDWTQNKSDYVDLRAKKTAAGGGKTWEIESSTDLARAQLEATVRRGTYTGPATTQDVSAAADYLAEKDPQGNVTKSAGAVRDEDLTTLFTGIAAPRVTRTRADLAHAALDTDLLMGAAKDQSPLQRVRNVTKELNQPLCPVWTGCESTEQAPRDEAIARSNANGGGETFSCGTAHLRDDRTKTWLGAALGVMALAEIVRRRTRGR
jgi:hypothetical protein